MTSAEEENRTRCRILTARDGAAGRRGAEIPAGLPGGFEATDERSPRNRRTAPCRNPRPPPRPRAAVRRPGGTPQLTGHFSAFTLSNRNEMICGVTLMRHRKPMTLATSDPRVLARDELQYGFGDGPCLTAIRELTTVLAPSLRRSLGGRCLGRGNRSSDPSSPCCSLWKGKPRRP